jgi:uncharacterized membrane protein
MNEWLLILVIILVLDGIYLSLIKGQFENMIIAIQRVVMTVKYVPAMFVYVLLVSGLYYFIVSKNKSVLDAFLLGVLVYGVYDMTNYATIKKWSLQLALMDMLWGGVLFGLTTYLVYKLR